LEWLLCPKEFKQCIGLQISNKMWCSRREKEEKRPEDHTISHTTLYKGPGVTLIPFELQTELCVSSSDAFGTLFGKVSRNDNKTSSG
jgi:hypothetical protein